MNCRTFLFTLLLTSFWMPTTAKGLKNPISYDLLFSAGEKECYALGDSLSVILVASQQSESCESGVQKTRIFCKGLKLLSETQWEAQNDNSWQKEIQLDVRKSSTDNAQLTAFRQTDSGKTVQVFTFKTCAQ